MPEQYKLSTQDMLLTFALMIFGLVEGIRLAMGHTQDLLNGYVRGAFVGGLFLLAIVYQTAKDDTRFRSIIGAVQVVAGLLLTFNQLGKLGHTGWHNTEFGDRCLFVLGSIAVLTKGMNDVWSDDEATK